MPDYNLDYLDIDYVEEFETRAVGYFKAFYGIKYTNYKTELQYKCNTSLRDFAFDLGCYPE